ncbi:MAG: S41 family peptidase [Deltaproteobacteria bacterium]|nr:S41 family peptidase [Deltaproteobacteria bacterium]MBI4374169.1 S41 family peptidase [Deltaproteobacteria bacterium]
MKRFRIAVLILSIGLLTSPSYSDKKETKNSDDLYKQLDLFTKALRFIQTNYVEEVSDKELIHGSIRGMLENLDPHSSFLNPESFDELRIDTEGRFGGVGIEVTLKDGVLTVVTPIEGSPAFEAKIREGDQIIKIDGVPTRSLVLADAVKKMRGKKGSQINLTIKRGGKEPFDVTLIRDIIRVQSVRSELLDDRYGYLRIAAFQEETEKELEKTLRSLDKKSNQKFKTPIKGLILDLRNNPGGLLDQATKVVDRFLKEGVIVSTRSRNAPTDKQEAVNDGNEPDYPIVVLINGGSASASEIVAGALQDHKRAVLLGTQTFGKGSVQTVFELGQGAAIKLTVARYYTPSGRSIQVDGIKPDLVVSVPESAQAIGLSGGVIREKDLKGHLEGKRKKAGKKEKGLEEESVTDFQKEAAINYLKSLDLLQEKRPSSDHP